MIVSIAVVVCLLACVALVAAELRDWPVGRAIFKVVASSAFVLVAAQVDATASPYGRMILTALALGWVGDVLLLSRRSRLFLLGIASFLVSHIVFATAFAHRPLGASALIVGLAVMSCVGLCVLLWLWRHLSGFFRVAVSAYVAAIVAMCSFAIAASAASGSWILAAAALAFAASDISVAGDRFVAPGFVNRAWGLPLYYAAQVIFALSAGGAFMSNANIADSAAEAPPVEPPAPAASAAPTMDALVLLEKGAYEAWKSRDAKFWETFLSDRFVGYGPNGKLDKASAATLYTGADCEIRSFAFSNEQMKLLGNDAALITYKSTVDGACGGQKTPVDRWAASVYVRDGERWRGVFHAEAPIVAPAATPAKPADKQHALAAGQVASAEPDADTSALHAAEKAVWEAWREHDARKIEAMTASDISFINIFGTYLPTKADAVKDWTGNGCVVKSVSVTDPVATMLSPTVGILTFNGGADGTCFGQEVGPIWGTSIYVKDGDAWKWTFGINLPARQG